MDARSGTDSERSTRRCAALSEFRLPRLPSLLSLFVELFLKTPFQALLKELGKDVQIRFA